MKEKRTRILVVDDDSTILTTLRDRLLEAGFEIDTAGSGEEALLKIDLHPVDIIVLDIMLPGISGLDVCQQVRARITEHIPIIVISVKGNEASKAIALRMGADDYISKPFSMEVLQRRLNAYLYNNNDSQSPETVFASGPLTIFFLQHCVQVNGQEVRLTPIEYQILAMLVQNRGKLITSEALLRKIWPNEQASSMLPLHEKEVIISIHNLRRKIERPAQCQFIITHHHMGYRFKPVE